MNNLIKIHHSNKYTYTQIHTYIYRIVSKNPCMSVMFDFNSYIIAGSVNGDIHLFKNSALYFEKDFMIENLSKEKMCLAKSYSAHVSFVN